MTTSLPMTSYFSREAMVSVLVPEEWSGQIVGDAQFRVFGPEHAEHDGYRPTMSYHRTEIAAEGEGWFEEFVAQAGSNLAADSAGYVQRGEEWFTLSSLARVHARWYEWQDEDTGLRFVQLQALILGVDDRLTVVNAATLEPLADRYVPVFEAILRSTRMIPEPPEEPAAGPLMRIAAAYFEQERWPFHLAEDGAALLTSFVGEHGHWTCIARANEADEVFLFYSLCPVEVPPARHDAVARRLLTANRDLTLGSFDLDYDDGSIRFRTSLDVEGDRLSVPLVRQLVQANVAMMDHHLPEIRALAGADEGDA